MSSRSVSAVRACEDIGDTRRSTGLASRIATVVATLVAASVGCFSPRYPVPGEMPQLGADEALVVGELRLLLEGVPVDRLSLVEQVFSPEPPRVQLSLLHVERDRRALYPRVDEDGTFAWILPVGTYVAYVTPPGPPARNEAVAVFQVPQAVALVFVGRLVLDVEPDDAPDDWPRDFVVLSAEVEPGPDEAALRERLLLPDARAERRPMLTDPELARLLDDYSRERCERILARHGWRVPPRAAGESPGGTGCR